MPNHVHLIAVPESQDGLRRAIGEAHRRYTRRINFREGWRGHLWQGRFSSFVMDNQYLMKAVRYVAMNPVKAGLVKRPEQYRWSSTPAFFFSKKDLLVNVSGLNERVDNWAQFLSQPVDSLVAEKMCKHEQTGRPLGSENFVMKLERILDRMLRPKKAGRKSNEKKKMMGSEHGK
jgi:putative transposase